MKYTFVPKQEECRKVRRSVCDGKQQLECEILTQLPGNIGWTCCNWVLLLPPLNIQVFILLPAFFRSDWEQPFFVCLSISFWYLKHTRKYMLSCKDFWMKGINRPKHHRPRFLPLALDVGDHIKKWTAIRKPKTDHMSLITIVPHCIDSMCYFWLLVMETQPIGVACGQNTVSVPWFLWAILQLFWAVEINRDGLYPKRTGARLLSLNMWLTALYITI